MRTLRWGVLTAAATGLVLAGWSRDASAAGFASQRIGGEQGGVIATNPTALYFNPGAMGFTGGGGLGAYTTVALRKLTYDRPGASSDNTANGAGTGNTGRASLFNVFGGPALGGMARIGNLVLGFGFFAPFFGRAHWDTNGALSAQDKANFPLAVDGVQRWFPGAIDAELDVYYFTWGAAYRFGPLSIGASGNAIYSKLVTTSASNALGNAQANSAQEWRASLNADAILGSFGAGAMLEIVPDQLYLGASYQAQPGMGQFQMNGNLYLNGFKEGMNNVPVSYFENLPDVVRAGIRWHLKAPWEIRLQGDWTRWSEYATNCLVNLGQPCVIRTDGSDNTKGGPVITYNRRNWNDTYGVHLGASYWPQYDIELFAGAWAETAAVPDATMDPGLTDAVNFTGALGARFLVSSGLYLAASYSHQQFLDRTVGPGVSTLAMKNGAPVKVPTLVEDGGGTYKQWIGYAQLNVEALFP